MLLLNSYPVRPGIGVTIGILVSSLQPVWAQSTASELSRFAGHRKLSRWVAQQTEVGPVGWQTIWQRFLAMGECAEGFLGDGLLAEKDRKLRLVLTGAYLVATRRHETVLLHRKIERRQHPGRVMALFALALGPRQPGEGKALAGWLKRAQSPLEQVVAYLALARFGNRAKLPDVVGKTKDPGVLAAALYCRPAQRQQWIETRLSTWSARGRDDHGLLVWRAYLLGRSSSPIADQDRRLLALRILRESGRGALPEAASFLAHDGRVSLDDDDILGQPLAIKLQFAASPDLRRRLLAKVDTRLRGTTSDLLLRRWWSLFTRYAPITAVVEALAQWRTAGLFKDRALSTSIGLALAWRLFATPEAALADLDLDISKLVDTPAGAWLQMALKRPRTASLGHEAFAELRRAYAPARDARLSRPRIAALLEQALWREGGHPARAVADLHRQLQSKLVIDAEVAAILDNNQVRGGATYTAKGVPRGDNLFLVATQLFGFIRRTEPWSMPEYRSAN